MPFLILLCAFGEVINGSRIGLVTSLLTASSKSGIPSTNAFITGNSFILVIVLLKSIGSSSLNSGRGLAFTSNISLPANLLRSLSGNSSILFLIPGETNNGGASSLITPSLASSL